MDKPIVLVTGSSQGIGAGIATYLGSHGFHVVITYKTNQELAEKLCHTISASGGSCVACQLDVTDEQSVKALAKIVSNTYGRLDVLVNNAAVDWSRSIEDISFADWSAITRTKIDGNFLCTKYFLPLLQKSENPNLLIIMSGLGYDEFDPSDPAYCVGTAGTIAFMKCMALALAKYNIRTNGIGAGPTKTNMKYWSETENTDAMWADLADKSPLKRLTTPEDVGKVALQIIQDETKLLNGNIIYVDGGSYLQ